MDMDIKCSRVDVKWACSPVWMGRRVQKEENPRNEYRRRKEGRRRRFTKKEEEGRG
jgi:hypothetical protein